MSIKKRKIKNNLIREIKIFFLSVIIISVLSGGAFVYFYVLSPNKNAVISPLVVQNLNHSSNNSFEAMLEKNNIPFSSVHVASDSSYVVILKSGGEVIMSPNKNVQNQISSLQLILSRLTIEGKQFKSLDLRYDKPVVVF